MPQVLSKIGLSLAIISRLYYTCYNAIPPRYKTSLASKIRAKKKEDSLDSRESLSTLTNTDKKKKIPRYPTKKYFANIHIPTRRSFLHSHIQTRAHTTHSTSLGFGQGRETAAIDNHQCRSVYLRYSLAREGRRKETRKPRLAD